MLIEQPSDAIGHFGDFRNVSISLPVQALADEIAKGRLGITENLLRSIYCAHADNLQEQYRHVNPVRIKIRLQGGRVVSRRSRTRVATSLGLEQNDWS